MAKKSEQAADTIATGLMWLGLIVLIIGVIVFYSRMNRNDKAHQKNHRKKKADTIELNDDRDKVTQDTTLTESDRNTLTANHEDVVDVDYEEVDDEV